MEIIPIRDIRWSDAEGEMVDTGAIIGYQVLSRSSATCNVIGSGETVTDAIEAALKATWFAQEA